MDWSAVFKDNGEEELNACEVYHDYKLCKLVTAAQHKGRYGPSAAYAFTINYILGVGCLAVPLSLQSSGYILGPLVLVMTTFMSYLAVMWLAETVARAEELAKLPCECGSKRWLCIRDHGRLLPGGPTSTSPAPRSPHHIIAMPSCTTHTSPPTHTTPINDGSHTCNGGGTHTSHGNGHTHAHTDSSAHTPLCAGAVDGHMGGAEEGVGVRGGYVNGCEVANGCGRSYQRAEAENNGGGERDGVLRINGHPHQHPHDHVKSPCEEGKQLPAAGSHTHTHTCVSSAPNHRDVHNGLRKPALKGATPQSPLKRGSEIQRLLLQRYTSSSSMDGRGGCGDAGDRGRSRTMDSLTSAEHGQVSEDKSYEVVELCYKFKGPWGWGFYQATLTLFLYTALLCYAQVFEVTVQEQFPWLCSPLISVVIFSAVVIPLACADLTEQVPVQVAMAIFRVVSLLLMFLGALVGLWFDPWDGAAYESQSRPYVSMMHPWRNSGFGLIFSTALFAQLFTYSVPGLIKPLRPDHRKFAKVIFSSALATTLVIYLLLGITSSLFFGNLLETAVNLNFKTLRWFVGPDKPLPWYLWITNQVVVIFPALDTLSVFPLMANTLGNNMAAAVPELRRHIRRNFNVKISSRCWTVSWRIAACVPPLVVSLVVKDLSLTLKLVGCCGVYIAFIAPAMLQEASRRSCRRQFGDAHTTMHSGWHSSLVFVYVVLAFAFIALAVTVAQIFGGR